MNENLVNKIKADTKVGISLETDSNGKLIECNVSLKGNPVSLLASICYLHARTFKEICETLPNDAYYDKLIANSLAASIKALSDATNEACAKRRG